MKIRNKIGMIASCVTLVGLLFPTLDDPGHKIYIAYFFVNPYPGLIIIASGMCFIASKRDIPWLLWLGAIACAAVVLSQFYSLASFVKLASDGFDLIRSMGDRPDFDVPRLGFAWVLLVPGSLACLFAAAMAVEKWGVERWVEQKLNSDEENTMGARAPKIAWGSWSVGGKVVFCATCLALFSFLLPWVDIGFTSRNGFTQGGFLLGALYIYPAYKLLTSQKGSRAIGMTCAVLAVLFSIIYISSKTVDIFGESINAASAGVEVFIVASILLGIGVWLRAGEPSGDTVSGSVNEELRDSNYTASTKSLEPATVSRVPCPRCAEMIMPQAKVCRYCGAKLEGEE